MTSTSSANNYSNIRPKIRGSLCVNANPDGCNNHVQHLIESCLSNKDDKPLSKEQLPTDRPLNVLIIGGSAGYGLASRVVSQVLYKANTISLAFEKEPTERKSGSAGWYNNQAVSQYAKSIGQLDLSINGDAFSNDTKNQVIELLARHHIQVDLLIYSLAAPRRIEKLTDNTEKTYHSVIKPINQDFQGKTIDVSKETLTPFSIEAATEHEIIETVKVMGGEDWKAWVDQLKASKLISENFQTVSFSYLGGDVTKAIYHDGTLGKAKEDLERYCQAINANFKQSSPAKVAVLKAIVTQSSAAIPSLSVYISALYKVMKEKGTHEDCITQIIRLFFTGLFPEKEISCDSDKPYRLRLDDFELEESTQQQVKELVAGIEQSDIKGKVDFQGFKQDFLKLFGFNWN